MDALRLLNFDDLFLLRHLLGGGSITSIALRMGLTQPAITQRVRKIERVFGTAILRKVGRTARLSEEGVAICEKAVAALSLMGEVRTGHAPQELSIGSRPEIGMSWLWSALVKLRKRHPDQVFQCHFGSGDEILRMLGVGALDAVVTSAPHAVRGYGAIEVAREDYVLAAAPQIARRVRTMADLRELVLIEHDRSFPFLRYLEAGDRAALKCKDVWLVGSTNTMTSALIEGLGVGIVPLYLARPALKNGKLRRVLPRVKLAPDHFRVVYRLDRDFGDAIRLLCNALIRTRLG